LQHGIQDEFLNAGDSSSESLPEVRVVFGGSNCCFHFRPDFCNSCVVLGGDNFKNLFHVHSSYLAFSFSAETAVYALIISHLVELGKSEKTRKSTSFVEKSLLPSCSKL